MALGAKIGLAQYEDYMETQNNSLDALDKNLVYFEKIIDLCKEKNLNLLLIEIPSATSWSNERRSRLSNHQPIHGASEGEVRFRPRPPERLPPWRAFEFPRLSQRPCLLLPQG